MKWSHPKHKTMVLAAAVLLFAEGVGVMADSHPTGDEVVAGLVREFGVIRDYRVQASLTVNGPDISINNMKLTVCYKKPDKIHVEGSGGLAIIPRGTFMGNPITDIAGSGKAEYVKHETRAGRACDVVRLRDSGTLVWADCERHVILATETEGVYGNKTTWGYVKLDGKYYLPCELRAQGTHSLGKARRWQDRGRIEIQQLSCQQRCQRQGFRGGQ